jgi:hypothetical protein
MPTTYGVRHLKLGLGVLLSIFGAFATVGAVINGFWYVTSCVRSSDPLREHFCPPGPAETFLLVVAAVILDVGAFMALRHRTRRGSIRRRAEVAR